MIDPKQCPHCDGYSWTLIDPRVDDPRFHIECTSCQMRGPGGFSRDNAVYKWNALPRDGSTVEAKP